MASEASTTRQQALPKLEAFCGELSHALARSGLAPDKASVAMQESASAECSDCGILISGAELFALSQPPSPELASAKIGRLRLGNCARLNCNAYFYTLTFRESPAVNWTQVLADADKAQSAPEHTVRKSRIIGLDLRWLVPRLSRRLWIPAAAVVVLLLLRQWHTGGRIPLVREPEHFRVDPDPNEGANPPAH